MTNPTHPPEAIFEHVARCFRVLGELTRLRILRCVCHDEKCVADIVAEVGSSQTNISRHLGVMYHSGILSRRRTGSLIYYSVANPVFTEVCQTLCANLMADNSKALR